MAIERFIRAGLVLSLLATGCVNHKPCLSSIEFGVNGGEAWSPTRDFDSEYVGGHLTATIDMTGACSVVESDADE